MQTALFTRDNALLVIVDVQAGLADRMEERKGVIRNITKLVKTARQLLVPIVVTEQYPQGLGRTIPELESLLLNVEPIDKITFSCCLEDRFITALSIQNRSHILITGMEAHICIMQTALDLVTRNCVVGIVRDAVCSYNRDDKETALMRLRDSGVIMTTTEMVMYELLRKAGTEDFKELLPILKDRQK